MSCKGQQNAIGNFVLSLSYDAVIIKNIDLSKKKKEKREKGKERKKNR